MGSRRRKYKFHVLDTAACRAFFFFLFLFRSLRLRTDLCNCAVLLESTECSTQADSPKVNVTSRRITTPRLKGSAKDKSIYVCAWL